MHSFRLLIRGIKPLIGKDVVMRLRTDAVNMIRFLENIVIPGGKHDPTRVCGKIRGTIFQDGCTNAELEWQVSNLSS